MQQNTGEGVTQKVGVMCEAFSFPGRNLEASPDTNVFRAVYSFSKIY